MHMNNNFLELQTIREREHAVLYDGSTLLAKKTTLVFIFRFNNRSGGVVEVLIKFSAAAAEHNTRISARRVRTCSFVDARSKKTPPRADRVNAGVTQKRASRKWREAERRTAAVKRTAHTK